MSWTAGVALDLVSGHWARLDWTLGGSQTSGGATWLSDLQCWEIRKANATADGFLQPETGTVAPAASPGHSGSPTGKGGEDPIALQDQGSGRGLGAPWAVFFPQQLHAGWWASVETGFVIKGAKGIKQSCQKAAVCPFWELCRQDQQIQLGFESGVWFVFFFWFFFWHCWYYCTSRHIPARKRGKIS